MAHIAFLATALSVTLFFLWRKQLDLLAVSLGSSLLYFAPGILGVMRFSFAEGDRWYTDPIEPATYGAMGIVLVALAFAAAVVDLVPQRGTHAASFQSKIPGVLLIFVMASAAMSIKHTGAYYLCFDKRIVLEKIDHWYSYASIAVPLCIATAYALRQPVILIIACVFLIADIVAGFRTGLAISLLAVVMLSAERLSRGWKAASAFVLIVLLAGATVFFVSKPAIILAKYATSSYCETRLVEERAAGGTAVPTQRMSAEVRGMSTMEFLRYTATNFWQSGAGLMSVVAQSEPFVIQATLNEVIRKDFRTDASYLVPQLLAGLPLGASLFGIDSTSVTTFSSRAQPVLFPDVTFGMANSPWAQAYAAGGLWMVAAFAAGYAILLGGLTLLFNRTEGALRAGVAVTGLWIGFYFHRNDLFIEIVYVKHVVYIFCAAIALAWLTSLAAKRFAR